MKLEHLNLVVTNIQASINFYQAAFPSWRVRGEGEAQWYGKDRRWCHLGTDSMYITLNDDGIGENRDLTGHQVGLAHFGFVVDDLPALMKRLATVGFDANKFSQNDNPYIRNAYYYDPDGFEVEFVEYLTDDPALRNQY
ncbi:Catechol 2,3-dioxygenase [Thalassotalea agarivorans]|uniref:Catechol 2,3-dioxygenase n=2 Tax=Thalassotalea agarivorans TaxID=349064 RepID=A0A1I0BKS6_THASX|nr:Catechol 2,3-dioxygenase [Thalassotalea agarivorans]